MIIALEKRLWLTLLSAVALLSVASAEDVATFYSAANFGGQAVAFPEGDYTTRQLQDKGIPDKSISSIKVNLSYQVIVYVGDQYQGDSMVLTGGINGEARNLKDDGVQHDLTGRVSSIRICKAVILNPVARDSDAEKEALDGWWTESMKNKDQRIQWWREARFGCFMHWGAYSVLGGHWPGASGGYAEHIMRWGKIPLAEYKKVAVEKFNPVQFNAEEWVKLLQQAGMKYLIITAKHHDGFAVFRSDAYYYDLDLTPFQRDPMLELREACTKYGLKFGFYYSQSFDWEHPDGAGNDWDYRNPGGDKGLWGGSTWYNQHPELVPRASKYYTDQKSIPQLLELIRKYHPDILWGDTDGKLPLSEKLKMLKAIRAVDENIVINGRFCRGGRTRNFGDYVNTGDRPAELTSNDGDWEAIPTTNESYGYKADDLSHKPVSYFVRLIAKAAARGGNILLNVGPRGDGRIDDPDVAILKGIGAWFKVNGECIYGSQKTPLEVQAWGESNRKGNTLYLHVFEWPKDGQLIVGGLKSSVTKAFLLADPAKTPLKTSRVNANDLLIQVPAAAPDPADSVVAVEVSGSVEAYPGRLLSDKVENVLRAFDAPKDARLGYGDGKTGRDYIQNWTSKNQTVKWRIRSNEKAAYQLAVKYTTDPRNNGSKYRITIGDQKFEKTVEPPAGGGSAKADLGTVTLPPGECDLIITPLEINGSELMKLYNVSLTPKATITSTGAMQPTTTVDQPFPLWFPKTPPLPPPRGEVIHVATVAELLAAVDRVGQGGTVLLADGHYKLPRVIVLEQKKDIAIRGARGDQTKVILSGKGWDSQAKDDNLLHIAHCEGVTIADLTFTDCHSYGIKVEAENAPKDIHIYNCRFRDIGVRAIKGSAGQDPNIRAVNGSVRGCYFENTKVPPADWLFGGDYISAIDMMALEDWTFSDNVFRNIKGHNGGGRAAIFIWVRSRRVVVERNLIINCDRGLAFGNPGLSTANVAGEQLAYVSDGLIRNNFIVGGPDCGIELWHTERIKVFNNTIWRPEQNWSRGIRVGTGTAHADIVNNLVHGEIRLDGGEAQMSRNLVGRLGGYFVDPASGNLALTRAATGAIDQGVSLPEVTDDIRRRPRPGRPDLGAWEFEGDRNIGE